MSSLVGRFLNGEGNITIADARRYVSHRADGKRALEAFNLRKVEPMTISIELVDLKEIFKVEYPMGKRLSRLLGGC